MLLAIFFLIGIALGLVGLRLLNLWEGRPTKPSGRPFHRHHS